MERPLDGRRIAFLTANEGVEQIELTSPWKAVTDAGADAVHLAPERGEAQGFDHLDKADVFDATLAVKNAVAGDFDALVLPGGVANPDQLRTDPDALSFVRSLAEQGKPIAVICHGPWTLIDAGLVGGRTMTSWPSLRADIEHAGGTWVDQQVVVSEDGPNTIVSSRKPDDLPAFERTLVDVFAKVRMS